jgi:5,10-methylenetetrahydromethanopterin reductase
MVNAAAIATLVSIAGAGRVAIGVGSGFTGRFTLGQKPMKWRDVVAYVRTLQRVAARRAGRMGRRRAADAPPRRLRRALPDRRSVRDRRGRSERNRGGARARRGIFGAGMPMSGFEWSVRSRWARCSQTARPAARRVARRRRARRPRCSSISRWRTADSTCSRTGASGPRPTRTFPNARATSRCTKATLVAVNDRDRPFVTGEMLAQAGLALTRDGWRERIALLESLGATEIAYQPAGPDIARELETFAAAVRG